MLRFTDEPGPPPPPAPAPTFHVVPLLGDPLAYDDRCVPFLSDIVTHPNWKLQIARGFSGCLGETLRDSFAVTADGLIVWSKPGMPDRGLGFANGETLEIASLDRLDCHRHREVGYYADWYRISVGEDVEARGGAVLAGDSEAAAKLDEMFDRAIAVYDHMRLLGPPIDLRLTTTETHWKLRLLDHHLTISRAGKLLYRVDLDDRELVDLIDRIVAQPQAEHPDARGTLYVDGRAIDVAIASYGGREPDPLYRAFESARYAASSAEK